MGNGVLQLKDLEWAEVQQEQELVGVARLRTVLILMVTRDVTKANNKLFQRK